MAGEGDGVQPGTRQRDWNTTSAVDRVEVGVGRIVTTDSAVLDGIRVDNHGSYLVSHWQGQVYAVSDSGGVVEVLDRMAAGMNSADFEYIPDRNLLIIPTFLGNKVAAYRLTEQ